MKHGVLSRLGYNQSNHSGFQKETYTTNTAPGVNNDESDTAAIGWCFRAGDFWLNTSTTTLYKCDDPTATAAVWSVVGGAPVFPNIFVTTMHSKTVIQGTFILLGVTTSDIWGAFYNSSNADGDEVNYSKHMVAGTYELQYYWGGGVNRGKIDVYVDGNLVINQLDTYAGSPTRNQLTTGNVTIATDGFKTIRILVNGKNASSSGYLVIHYGFNLERTS